ncbi:MAG: hypothetical protein L3J79_09180, partial [Candidatus Marinimicrobia bacterium]|nr:hypothetical protein [Candidatus Neomarinimicrobiota bacterium]
KKEKKCVICHAQWHVDRTQEDQLIPDIETNIFLDGRPAMVSNEEMCLSCHDGYVLDSREVFNSANHRGDLDISHLKIQGLPLGQDGKIYCGTCHTPHALKPDQRGGLAPFLREQVTNSTLCLDCHSNQAGDHKNHPIHVKQPANHKLPESAFFGDNNSVECLTCHPLHRTQAAYGVEGNDRSELCSACHSDYFNIQLSDHDLPLVAENKKGGLPFSMSTNQDVCATCHSSHAGKGPAIWAMDLKPSDGGNAVCLGCHSVEGSGREKAFKHAGHPVADEQFAKDIPVLGISAGDRILCTTCHNPHQWDSTQSHQLSSANEEGTEFTSFLRLPDDETGQLCTACHDNKRAIIQSDHSTTRAGFEQYFAKSGQVRGQCSVCHETHAAVNLKVENAAEVADLSKTLCESCHGITKSNPSQAGFNHPLGEDLGIDFQLPTNGGQLTCITCHDPHIWGTVQDTSLTKDLVASDANSFLRIANWPEPQLCLTCHEDQNSIMMTDHDLGDDQQNACSVCHSAHKAQGQYGILSVWDESAGNTYNESFCFSCHQLEGRAADKIPEAWTHPQKYRTITPNLRGSGKWIDFPLFDHDKPNKTVGFIDCFTCHDPHTWSYNDLLAKQHTDNDEGDFMTSFLRNPSKQTLCTDCHGPNTLWKFKYYHDPQKRLRY